MVFPRPGPSRAATGVFDMRHFYANAAGYQLYLNEHDSDVSIRVQWNDNSVHLPAHKLVLSSMSDVFRRMFQTDMAERQSGEIKIKDSSPVTVKQFLKYMYMGTVDFSGWMEAVELMKIAHKYGVNTLVALCESYLTTAITFSNACCLYETAQTYSLENLEKQACTLILGAAFIVTTTDGFLNLKPRSLEFFLKSSNLNMENECCVLSTLREWAVVNCSTRGVALTRNNVLEAMKPFMKFINWSLIPEQLRTFVPDTMARKYENLIVKRRNKFQVVHPLQNYIHYLKFVVQLGSYHVERHYDSCGLTALTFGVGNHAYVAGFKILGLFKRNFLPTTERHFVITLGRDDNKSCSVFNLNSLPWTTGATVDNYTWLELTAYLPYPVRVNPFSTYTVTLRNGSRLNSTTMWPNTCLDSGVIESSVGTINFYSYSESFGITQLFILPASHPRNVCN